MRNFDTYQEKYENKQRLYRNTIRTLILCIIFSLVGISIIHTRKDKPTQYESPSLKSHNRLTDKQWAYAKFFQATGSDKPHDMAVAVTATKRPKLFAKIAVTETNGNPHKRKYGYRKAHDGAFGVNRYDWGPVSHNALEQALQAENAYETFLKESNGNERVAKRKYGGEKIINTYNKKLRSNDQLLAQLVDGK